jgi:heme O synthase-like polyprenyltransferase
MNKLNTLLRQLEPWQILAVGAVVWVIGIAVVVFGLIPLATLLLLPVGEAYAAVGGLIVAIGGGIFVGSSVGRVFAPAYYDRKMDVAMERLYAAFAESKRNGG